MHQQLLQTLHDCDLQQIVERWLLEMDASCYPPGPPIDVRADLECRCRLFLESLAHAVRCGQTLDPGSPELREPIQHLAFISGWLAGRGVAVGVVVALCHALREVLELPAQGLVQDLTVAATEAYVAGVRERDRAQHRQIVLKSQVVCSLSDQVCVLFLVADPQGEALQDAVERLLTLALMRDASHVLIVGTGLIVDAGQAEAAAITEQVLEVLATHREGLQGRTVMLADMPGPRPSATVAARLDTTFFDEVSQALAAVERESFDDAAVRVTLRDE